MHVRLCAARCAGDASHGLLNAPRRRAATIGSMLKLQAAGGLESDLHAVSGVVSTGDPKLATVGPPHLLAWSIALARAMRSCVCTAAVGSEPTRAQSEPAHWHFVAAARAVYRARCGVARRPCGHDSLGELQRARASQTCVFE